MKTRQLDFSDVHLYAVTPDVKDGDVVLSKIEGMLAGGVDAVQLRSQTLPDRELIELGRRIKAACEKFGALFLINNRADLALAMEADGVHLGHMDLPIPSARQILGHRRLIGATAHSLSQALEAQKFGADYVSCGPIWATPTKPDYPAVGLDLIGMYRAAMRVPFVAIGGIDETNIEHVIQSGAKCVAVVRALFDAADPEKTARILVERMGLKKEGVSL